MSSNKIYKDYSKQIGSDWEHVQMCYTKMGDVWVLESYETYKNEKLVSEVKRDPNSNKEHVICYSDGVSFHEYDRHY